MKRILQLARLNARVAGLALQGRWLGPKDVAAGYNRVAATYEEAWHRHLRQATDELLQRLPVGLSGTVLDLGSGTGYSAIHLAQTNPGATVLAVDLSDQMLDRARARAPANLGCVVADMLEFVRSQETASVGLIVSAWALGYSHASRLFRECSRLLSSGGTLAFIVNYADTLAPVFLAFRRCMLRFPDCVRLAAVTRFPKDWNFLQRTLERNRFAVEWHQEGRQHIPPPAGELLPWLQQTGILAGFDAMLDLSAAAGAFFEAELARDRDNLFHHFAMAIARRV
jgi:SAM-dependent methyltransferase